MRAGSVLFCLSQIEAERLMRVKSRRQEEQEGQRCAFIFFFKSERRFITLLVMNGYDGRYQRQILSASSTKGGVFLHC